MAVAEAGGSRRGAQGARAPPYFWTKLRPEGPKKMFLETTPPPPLCQGLDDRAPPYLKVWIRQCMGHFS